MGLCTAKRKEFKQQRRETSSSGSYDASTEYKNEQKLTNPMKSAITVGLVSLGNLAVSKYLKNKFLDYYAFQSNLELLFLFLNPLLVSYLELLL